MLYRLRCMSVVSSGMMYYVSCMLYDVLAKIWYRVCIRDCMLRIRYRVVSSMNDVSRMIHHW